MTSRRSSPKKFLFLALALVTAASVSITAAKDNDKDKDKDKIFTGTVGDTLCGLEHSMPGSPVDCIRECRGKGSNFSLIVGDKVYNLETEDKTILDMLEKEEGEKVTLTGSLNGTNVNVTSVKAAR